MAHLHKIARVTLNDGLSSIIKEVSEEINIPREVIGVAIASQFLIVYDEVTEFKIKSTNKGRIIALPVLGKFMPSIYKIKRIRDRYYKDLNYVPNKR